MSLINVYRTYYILASMQN